MAAAHDAEVRDKAHATWLASGETETPLDAQLLVIDAHHHLWDRTMFPRTPSLSIDPRGWCGQRLYLLPEYLEDLETSGHKICGTVFVDCHFSYRREGPELWKALGEVEAMHHLSKRPQSARFGVGAAIVASGASLRFGHVVAEPLLKAMKHASPNFRGVRFMGPFEDQSPGRIACGVEKAGVHGEPAFREAFGLLEELDLSFDAWVYSTQLNEIVDLAKSFPRTRIVVDHLGGPLGRSLTGVRPHPGPVQPEDVYAEWVAGIHRLAQCPNVYMKLSGFIMPLLGAEYNQHSCPPSSEDLEIQAGPLALVCIDAFGAQRCMFASNFPVDKCGVPYKTLLNFWKRIARRFPPKDAEFLLHKTASDFYRLSLPSSL